MTDNYLDNQLGVIIPEEDRPETPGKEIHQFLKKNLKKAIGVLSTDLEKEILKQRFSGKGLSVEETAAALDITVHRVISVEAKAYRRLRRGRNRIV